MLILSHRGFWQTPAEKNTPHAFSRSFDCGFGTETDIRDHANELVISHDMPQGTELFLSQFLDLLSHKSLPLALNIKADGLALAVKNSMQNYPRDSWFVFDMSIPDMRAHLACGNPVFARVSEIETYPTYLHEVQGIWLDAFYHDGWQLDHIKTWLKLGKKVCLVSPELHKRDHHALWDKLRQQDYINDTRLMLCTDYPQDAHLFFGKSL